MEAKLKHLDLIQGVVNRLAQNSFLLKGWAVTLVSALLALSVTAKEKIALVSIAFVPVVVFWILDGYYLWQERLFREVYKDVSKKAEKDIDFVMNPMAFSEGSKTWLATLFSKTIIIFYLSLLLTMGLVIWYLWSKAPH